MAENINKVTLKGRAGRNAEIRYTPNGKAIISFSLATSNDYKDQSGQWIKKDPSWHKIVIFGNNEIAANVMKGDKVQVEGKLTYDEWTDREGNKRVTAQIVGFNVEVFDTETREAYATQDNRPIPEDDVPF